MSCLPLFASLLVMGNQAPRVEARYSLEIFGSKVGTVRHQEFSDGRIVSEVEVPEGLLKGKSRWEGVVKGDDLVSFTLVGDVGGKISATLADGRIKGNAAGRAFDVPAKPKLPVFANFHVGLNRTVMATLKDQAEAKFTLFLAENLQAVPSEVKRLPAKSVTVDGVRQTVEAAELKIGGLSVLLYADATGQLVAEDVPSQRLRFTKSGYESLFEDPLAKYPELSQPTFQVEETGREEISMRDGVKLRHTRLSPKGEGKYPTILIRTPYGRAPQAMANKMFAQRGYVVIVQDTRGREDSEGEFDPFFHEGQDGFDTIAWIEKQPWSDGKVGMIGGSYVGAVQWQAAVTFPKALKCIIPQVSPPGPFGNIPYEGGAFALFANTWWANVVRDRTFNAAGAAPSALTKLDEFLKLPLHQVDDALLGKDIPFYNHWLERTKPSDFGDWDFTPKLHKVKVPALMISGWFDGDGIGTRLNWQETRRNGIEDQWLIYGPWTHAFNTTSKLGDVDFGPDAILELDSLYLRWFDHWLKGKSVGLEKLPRAKIFFTGANQWADLDDWPASNGKQVRWYFGGDGPSNGATSVGTLLEKPANAEPDRYLYNPAAIVVPEGMKAPEQNQTTKIDSKAIQEALVYRSEPFTKPTRITGPVDVDLHFMTSAKDADFIAVLAEENEKGEMRLFGMPGVVRAGYFVKGLQSNRAAKVTIKVWDIAHEFKPGSRLVVLVGSDRFPMFARNLGTGEPIAKATRMVAAHQTIFRDPKRPSSVRFTMMPN